MPHIIQLDISKSRGHYIAEGVNFPLMTQAKTLKGLAKNLEEIIELHLTKDPDEGLALTARAKQRMAYAKRHYHKKSTGITLVELEKKYL